jgi:hypothetical protein
VESTQHIIHEEGKTIRFNLTQEPSQTNPTWQRKAARRHHNAINAQAKTLLPAQLKQSKQTTKQFQRRE